MGIDPLKPKGPTTVSQPTSVARASTPETNAPPDPDRPAATEGFDDPKKKLVSVTGGYKAYQPNFAPRDDLKALVDAQRVGGVSAGAPKRLQDAATTTAANLGNAPAARDPSADFVAQAKKANPKGSPADIEAAACKLAKAAIEKDFGMKVKNGDKNWTAEQLSRAYESLKAMPAADQGKLKGLDLIRQSVAPPESTKEAGGTVAGEYNPNVKTTGGKRDAPGSITLYDAAFDGASRQDTMHVVTHEAGHAVEGRDRDDAIEKMNEASDRGHATKATADAAAKPVKAAWDDYNKSTRGFAFRGSDKPAAAFAHAQESVSKAMESLQNAKTPKDAADAQTKLDAAMKKRDAALAGMSGSKLQSKAQAIATASDAVEQPVKDYSKANLAFLKDKAAYDDAKKAVGTVATTTGGSTSKELAAFNRAKGREKSVSTYGAKASAEGYAEAYALYQRDPGYMKQHFPNQYNYFHANHQSPRDP